VRIAIFRPRAAFEPGPFVPPTTDMSRLHRHVGFVPISEVRACSAHGKSSDAEGSNISIEPSRIAPKLGFQP
jgi:hypothetical protein